MRAHSLPYTFRTSAEGVVPPDIVANVHASRSAAEVPRTDAHHARLEEGQRFGTLSCESDLDIQKRTTYTSVVLHMRVYNCNLALRLHIHMRQKPRPRSTTDSTSYATTCPQPTRNLSPTRPQPNLLL